MALYGVSSTKINDRALENPEQDQTANICRLILLHTVREINAWSEAAGQELTVNNQPFTWYANFRLSLFSSK